MEQLAQASELVAQEVEARAASVDTVAIRVIRNRSHHEYGGGGCYGKGGDGKGGNGKGGKGGDGEGGNGKGGDGKGGNGKGGKGGDGEGTGYSSGSDREGIDSPASSSRDH
jgi:hypothetical protein